jgi:TolA-binding protein
MNESWPDINESEQEFLARHGETIRRAKERQANCPPPQLIIAAKGEGLPEELRLRVNEHLQQCKACRMLAEDLEATEPAERTAQEKARMRARLEPMLGTSASSRPWSWVRGLALRPVPIAVLALAVLAVGGFFLAQRMQERGRNVAHVPPPNSPLVVAATLPLEKPAIALPQDSDIIWRGGETSGTSYPAQLEAALKPYDKGDYAGAAEKLRQLEKKFPGQFEAKFYRGVCLLFLNDATAAAELQAARGLGKGPESYEAAWYLAIAEQRNGRNDSAVAELQKLCQTDSAYAPRACEATESRPSH